MQVEGTCRFTGPREAVWPLLFEPDVLARSLPGMQRLRRTADDTYEGVMQIGVGPITAVEFDVTIVLRDVQPPERYRMEVDGKGRFGYTRGHATIELRETGSHGTEMRYRAALEVGGTIAAVGQRLLDALARAMTKHGLEALSREVNRRLAGGGSP